MPNAAGDIVSDIMAKWAEAFGRLDADALSALYSKQALFFGSNPQLYRGSDGVAAYFESLPRWRTPEVQFSDVAVEKIGPDLISFAGTASFELDQGAIELSLKITWVIARVDGDWKIVNHHVSSKAPLL